jgi:hypothetical protein
VKSLSPIPSPMPPAVSKPEYAKLSEEALERVLAEAHRLLTDHRTREGASPLAATVYMLVREYSGIGSIIFRCDRIFVISSSQHPRAWPA